MLLFSMPKATTPAPLQVVLVFAAGALLVVVLGAVIRAALTALLEPRGHRLDLWRRVWFHPERELALFLETLLIVAFVAGFVRHYALPAWVTPALAGVWALHLPADLWNWFRTRPNPRGTRELHERGFLLLDLGPLGLRAVVALLAGGLYFLVPPLRAGLDTMLSFLLGNLQRWFSG